MLVALITAAGLVLVAAVSALGQWLNARNDRTLTHQEVDLLKKLDPMSEGANALAEVVELRIASWKKQEALRQRRFKWRGSTARQKALTLAVISSLILALSATVITVTNNLRRSRDYVIQANRICADAAGRQAAVSRLPINDPLYSAYLHQWIQPSRAAQLFLEGLKIPDDYRASAIREMLHDRATYLEDFDRLMFTDVKDSQAFGRQQAVVYTVRGSFNAKASALQLTSCLIGGENGS